MLEKFLSRKLLVAITGIVTAAQTDEWGGLVVAGVAVAYVLGQAYVDAVGAANTRVDEVINVVERVLAKAIEGAETGRGANG